MSQDVSLWAVFIVSCEFMHSYHYYDSQSQWTFKNKIIEDIFLLVLFSTKAPLLLSSESIFLWLIMPFSLMISDWIWAAGKQRGQPPILIYLQVDINKAHDIFPDTITHDHTIAVRICSTARNIHSLECLYWTLIKKKTFAVCVEHYCSHIFV